MLIIVHSFSNQDCYSCEVKPGELDPFDKDAAIDYIKLTLLLHDNEISTITIVENDKITSSYSN